MSSFLQTNPKRHPPKRSSGNFPSERYEKINRPSLPHTIVPFSLRGSPSIIRPQRGGKNFGTGWKHPKRMRTRLLKPKTPLFCYYSIEEY